MAGRRTNLALLALLAAALVTGALAYAIGTGWARWAVIAHAAAGFALLVLAPWKSVVARRGLARPRAGRWASVLFSVLVAVALAFGVGHATGLLRTLGPVTAMQVHVGAALASIPFAVWHVLARRVRPRATDLTRRNLLRAAGVVAAGGAVYAGVEGALRAASLPGSRRRFTGSYPAGSFDPDRMPVTQWLNDSVPVVDADAYRLRLVDGDGERELSYREVAEYAEPLRATLDCTGGWYAEQDWEGVPLRRLFPDVGDARSVAVTSVTGYSRRFPVRDLPHLLLATRVGGAPLRPGHGYPARIVAPGRRGFWWVKWVSEIRLSAAPWWWQPPFPLT